MGSFPYSLFICCPLSFIVFALLPIPGACGRDQLETRHVVSVSQLLPKSACSSRNDLNPWRMAIVHQHGPCSPFTNSRKPLPVQILKEDQARVDSLHRRISLPSRLDRLRDSQTVQLPANTGGLLGTGNYIVKIGFGTPAKQFSVEFDTGSDVTWIQCSPCSDSNCYQQDDPLFDPSQSSTYANLSCNSTPCHQLDQYNCSASSICRYKVEYGDNSQTEGNFGSDTLTLMSDMILNFKFGCGDKNSGLFGRAAGLTGLGRGKLSLVSQLSSKYGAIFSYCLPSTTSSVGYLTIGGVGATSGAKYTKMVKNDDHPSFYFINLVAIKVGGKMLSISPTVFSTPGTLIDSGTVITRLPPTAYKALRSAFQQHMTQYKPAPALSILDTCYNFTGYTRVAVPTIALVFGGGVTLNVDFSGILYVADVSQACLAFSANQKSSDLVIIGNVQQRRYNVIFDIAGGKIGFAANACS